jgi:hypothetical protein
VKIVLCTHGTYNTSATPRRMVKTNITQDGIGRSLSEPFCLPFSRLMKWQMSDGAFAVGARLTGREAVVSPFCLGPLPVRETLLLNLAVATLINVPVVAAGWLAGKSLRRVPNLRRCKMTFGRLLDQSVRGAAKGSPCDYRRNRSRDAEHFTRRWRRKSSQ